jgi:hypothetical protein
MCLDDLQAPGGVSRLAWVTPYADRGDISLNGLSLTQGFDACSSGAGLRLRPWVGVASALYFNL